MVSATLARMSAQVHITGLPMPKNLSESKLILAALQKFGEVITYRNLKYDTAKNAPNQNRPILAIFETSDAADRAIAASPITIPLPTPTSTSSKYQPSISTPFTSTNPPSNTARSLTLEIQPSRHNHASAVTRNPFYSTYNLYKDSPIYEDLVSDETGIPLIELADTLSSKKHHIGPGVKSNIQDDNRRMGATSLANLWKEGMWRDRYRGGGIREPGEGLD
ncbi:hypothetical protein N7465_011435 [Penicillium sp. CMV-2018d]|nr:hypothetical protein N7465_011435 [Penicillium sp. CMV-2018d]